MYIDIICGPFKAGYNIKICCTFGHILAQKAPRKSHIENNFLATLFSIQFWLAAFFVPSRSFSARHKERQWGFCVYKPMGTLDAFATLILGISDLCTVCVASHFAYPTSSSVALKSTEVQRKKKNGIGTVCSESRSELAHKRRRQPNRRITSYLYCAQTKETNLKRFYRGAQSYTANNATHTPNAGDERAERTMMLRTRTGWWKFFLF